MPRDMRAYLADVIDSCKAIESALAGLDLSAYQSDRLVRSAVEREFIIIGEALSALSRRAPDTFAAISNARRIIDFRNQLTHEYPTIDDAIVWAIADRDVPRLRAQVEALLDEHKSGETTD